MKISKGSSWTGSGAVAVAILGFALPSFVQAADLDFEQAGAGWELPKPCFSVEKDAGRSGYGLVWRGAETSRYAIAQTPIDFKPGERLRVSAWIKDELTAGRPNLCLEFFGDEGYLTGKGVKLPKKDWRKGVWQRYTCETGPLPPAATKVAVRVAVQKGGAGKCSYDDIVIERLGRDTVGLFFSSAPDDKAAEGLVRFSATTYANVRAHRPEDLDVSFSFNGGRLVRKPDRFKGGIAEITLDAKELDLGAGFVSFDIRTKAGEKLEHMRMSFTRLEKAPSPAVRFDAQRRLVIDGKVTYPLLVYTHSESFRRGDDRIFRALEKSPFRLTTFYNDRPTREDLDRFAAHGIRVIMGLDQMWAWSHRPPREIGNACEEAAHLVRLVGSLKDHPALLGWYLFDEPHEGEMLLVRSRYKLMKALDTEHLMLGTICHADLARDVMAACDVVALDHYPIPGTGTEKTNPAPIGNAGALTRRAVNDMRRAKPFWFVPQSCTSHSRWDRFPTEREMASMVWQSIAGGADGVLFYALNEMLTKPENENYSFWKNWEITCRVANQIRDREDFLLSAEQEPPVEGVPEKKLVARAWSLNGKTFVVAVNRTHEPVSATIVVGGKSVAVELGGDEVLKKEL